MTPSISYSYFSLHSTNKSDKNGLEMVGTVRFKTQSTFSLARNPIWSDGFIEGLITSYATKLTSCIFESIVF